ncbi:bifunctional diaminohydroxyphosphoribosylaminopyrimidine deaminase/5-amino-6-(5-phosphoribosylamino)uracil reductase RibD [Arenibacter palladensis]|uniref:bifunctional diaminohydroxyphosphoribosylaminopyrimidine deaminase/5-amino-6-(5-phosphoribosylamino)uracil reductase RibD n=1 Tax=Arenibacter palladensis TaxID=237373 RepID=UPI0026E3DF74|nr:bifunctional diaminohydroxyphosphoribosylaminopyrimidine deaminase/5-amino-6-(5-phosphoribosylamino)uracil reductase RibD [Arenibacter palladensis]MDO6605461.1 bifunctional diaminohydroxyphosphoribosylaminopyrimidine deaminase/5-amino-6-(5-phosphoribosylamino)uracil reductase RibD [Arenibacter palladensis]
MKIHEKYISRCIQLAKNGLGTTFPNPMVGSVIMHGDKIIGEGYTSPYGGSHAEVNAINSVKDKSLLSKATLYVTLEPCSHYGKTPPCADLIVKHQIPNVVIGLLDPHEKVAGKGIEKLKVAGCNVTVGVLEKECLEHHKRFITSHTKKRPYIILKWAETADGFIAPSHQKRNNNPQPYWISNPYSQQLVHQWRSQEQAILVGTNTVLADNPKLNVRHWKGKNPIRIVLDRELKIGYKHHVLDGSVKTIIITANRPKNPPQGIFYEIIDFENNLAAQICAILHKHEIISVIIEGGAKTLQSFIDSELWDEARIFKGKNKFGEGLESPRIHGFLQSETQIESDILTLLKHD